MFFFHWCFIVSIVCIYISIYTVCTHSPRAVYMSICSVCVCVYVQGHYCSQLPPLFHRQYTHHGCHSPSSVLMNNRWWQYSKNQRLCNDRWMFCAAILSLYMTAGCISIPVCLFQQQWRSINILCIFHVHILFPTTSFFPTCTSILIFLHYSTSSK